MFRLSAALPCDAGRRPRCQGAQGDDPALVALETLPGRNHYEFPAAEEPAWRWLVGGRYPGFSS